MQSTQYSWSPVRHEEGKPPLGILGYPAKLNDADRTSIFTLWKVNCRHDPPGNLRRWRVFTNHDAFTCLTPLFLFSVLAGGVNPELATYDWSLSFSWRANPDRSQGAARFLRCREWIFRREAIA